MKIILSPTKTQVVAYSKFLESKDLLYPHKHAILVRKLKSIPKLKLKALFNVSDTLFEKVYFNVVNHEELLQFQAFEGYNGLVFKGLEKASYQEEEYEYITEHVRILDAFYGVLEPGSLIRNYRLDFKTNLGMSLYDFWKITPYFKDEIVVNLASSEYSKMLKGLPMIDIHFLEEKNGVLKNKATYSKQARGLFLNYCIQNQITTLEKMKEYQLDGYQYNQGASKADKIVFSRTI